jgi:hypothetical protein
MLSDARMRTHLLSALHGLRNSNTGWVPVHGSVLVRPDQQVRDPKARRAAIDRTTVRTLSSYNASTIRSLIQKPVPADAEIEVRWLAKYSRPTKIKFVGIWDTVGSMGIPRGSAEAKVHKYRFLDTHLRLDNEFAFHALALDEHREDFEATFWTRTVKTGEAGAPQRPLEHVQQRWFVGCHANVGGGYSSDLLSQRPLIWLMEKAGAQGLVYRNTVDIDVTQVVPPINDSYREFGKGFYHLFSKRFYRSVGTAPDKGTAATTSRINETIDGSVFDRWRNDASYRPWSRGRMQSR